MARRPRIADPLDQAQLAGFAVRRRERSLLEVEDLLEALDWALRHPAVDAEPHTAVQAAVNQGWLASPAARDDALDASVSGEFDDPWTPPVDWSAFAPVAAAMGRSTAAGKALVTDALVLAVRVPKLFEAVRSGRVEVWRARRIAQAVRMRPVDVAEHIDAEVTPVADSIGLSRLESLIDAAMLKLHAEERELEVEAARESHGVELSETFHGFHGSGVVPVAEMRICGDVKDLTAFDATVSKIAAILGEQERRSGLFPEPLEARKARAVGLLADPHLAAALLDGARLEDLRTVHGIQLVVHMTAEQARNTVAALDPVVSVDSALRARVAELVAEWCNRPESAFKVLPVIDLNEHGESASDAVTEAMSRRARLRTPTCVFPFCDRPSRSCDVDHRVPTGDGVGQHGRSCDCNLVPLCRHHHRLKTFAGWAYTPIEASVWLWTDPHGRQYLRDHHSTRDVTVDDAGVSIADADGAERRDELRRRRIRIRAGCRKPDPVSVPADDPPPF